MPPATRYIDVHRALRKMSSGILAAIVGLAWLQFAYAQGKRLPARSAPPCGVVSRFIALEMHACAGSVVGPASARKLLLDTSPAPKIVGEGYMCAHRLRWYVTRRSWLCRASAMWWFGTQPVRPMWWGDQLSKWWFLL